MAANEDYLLLVTDAQLRVVADPITSWTALDVTLKWNEPDSNSFDAPALPWIREAISVPGRRIVVIREGQILTAGPVERWLWEQSDNGDNAGNGNLSVNFADDFAFLAAREVYPDPARSPEEQIIDSWGFTGNGEQALRALINANGGPGARPERQVQQLVLGPVAGAGGNVTVKTHRMDHLGDVARAIADAAGGIGFRTRQVGSQIQFEVYTPPDKSHLVRFGFALGNMRYRSIEVVAPTCTTAIVGGQGEGTDAFMITRTNTVEEAAWGRFEKLASESGDEDLTTLQDAGDKALGEGASTIRIATNVSDTPDQKFGTHYQLGDIVSLESAPGEETSQVVRTVHIQVSAGSGEYIAATVGSQEATADPAWVKKIREIDERLSTVERVVTPI